MSAPQDGTTNYVLGHSDQELERLRLQAKLVDPITRQFLIEAGISDGMQVLDVGSGAGDVAFLVASLVGPTGSVVGTDRSPVAVERAKNRAAALELSNVTFQQCDLYAMDFGRDFDAVVGRYVLCFQPDPVLLLKKLSNLRRRGGIILFHEPNRSLMRSVPPTPAYDSSSRWLGEAYLRNGVDVNIGPKLYSLFTAAGIGPPTMRLHAIIGGPTARDEVHLDADQVVVMADEIVRLGLATAIELSADTLADRIIEELAAEQGVIVGRGEIGAWSSA